MRFWTLPRADLRERSTLRGLAFVLTLRASEGVSGARSMKQQGRTPNSECELLIVVLTDSCS